MKYCFTKHLMVLFTLVFFSSNAFSWGFFAHERINYYAVFCLPPEMMVLYKPNILFLREHATDPDKRRYAVAAEGPRHYIDIDHYGNYPYPLLPRKWETAVERYSADTLETYGIVPWWIQTMAWRLTTAFKEKNQSAILKLSAEIGHYIADAHVPLHACSNHNGQHTGQHGIHGFWEGRIPELLAEKEYDFLVGRADYIADIGRFTWSRVLESAAAADTVLRYERELTAVFPPDAKYAFEIRKGKLVRQYATAFTKAYHLKLGGMVERRMQQSVYAIASIWYSAWVNAGQPDLTQLLNKTFSAAEQKDFDELNEAWRKGKSVGREEE
jgi:hypothetical protein